MAVNYTGNPTATESPGPAISSGQIPILSLPVDTDAGNVASIYQPHKEAADFIAWLMQAAPGGTCFGDGSFGNSTLGAGVTTLPGLAGAILDGSNVYFDNLTIGATSILETAARVIRVRNTLTIASGGLIRFCDPATLVGGNGVSTTGGTPAAIPIGPLRGTTGGVGGNAGNVGFNGAAGALLYAGGAGGTGGGSGAAVGGAGGASNGVDEARRCFLFHPGYQANGSGIAGGMGGGGGGALGSAGGGAGGAGGGIVAIYARRVVIAAANNFLSAGGAGGNGNGTNGGGGAGGGGGVVFLGYGVKSGPALTAATCCPGGVGGTGGVTATPGAAGSNGTVIEFSMGL